MEHFYGSISGWMDFEDIYGEMVQRAISSAHFVEVGSWMGCSSAYMAVEIANSGKAIRFDCVDTWAGSEEHRDPHSGVFFGELLSNPDWLYSVFIENTKSVAEYLNPIRMESIKAAELYSDNTLDFVFIDASHEYENIKADIAAWYPKVKPGSFIGGHDYYWPGVFKAVNEFVAAHNYLNTTQRSSWLIQKRSL